MPSNVSSNILEIIKCRASPRLENIMPLMLGQNPASLETPPRPAPCKPTRIHAKFAADLAFALHICSAGLVLNEFSTDYCTQACHTEACSVLFPV